MFFAAQLGAMALVALARPARLAHRAIGWTTVMVVVAATLATSVRERAADEIAARRDDAIAAQLSRRLGIGEGVQPLDWTGSTLRAMLQAGARPATAFFEDVHFYHHVDSPYIQGLRNQFVAALGAAAPALIVRVRHGTWAADGTTSLEFPELDRLIAAKYRLVEEGESFQIYRRDSRGVDADERGLSATSR